MAECAGGSKDGWNLPGFTITEESVHDFRELVRSYWSKANLPRYNEPSLWKVYLLTPSQWFKHHSLLIENTDTRACFTIELGFGETSVIPVSRRIDSKHYQHLVKVDLGTVSSTATQLFVTALECLQDFGDYQKIVNNCQLFCKVQTAAHLGYPTPGRRCGFR